MGRPVMAIVCCCVVACLPYPVRGDELPLLEVGNRVRVTSSAPEPSRLAGTSSAVDAKSLTVVPKDGHEPRVFARQEVARLERSVRPSHKSRGAVIGFAVGLAAALGRVAINDGCNGGNVAVGVLFASSTAAVGALAAAGERWEDVALGPQPGRATLSSRAGPRVRLVPQVGRRTGLVLVASF